MLRRPLAVVLTALMLPTLPVRPRSFGLVHSWYPQYCCQDDDCRTADRIEKLPDGSMGVDASSMHASFRGGSCNNRLATTTPISAPTRCLLDNTFRGASFYLEPSNQGAPGLSCISKGALPKSHGLQVIALFDGLGRAHRPQMVLGLARDAHAVALTAGMVLQLLGAGPGCCACIGIIPQWLG